MKQKELIKQKVKSVSRVLLLMQMCCMLHFESQAQTDQKLTKEQYQVIEGAFKNSASEYTRIFFKTIDFKSWVVLLNSEYLLDDKGIGFCIFDDPELEKAFDSLPNLVRNIEVKNLDPKKLGNRFRFIKDVQEKYYLSISEPMIVGNHAFIFFQGRDYESLFVVKKNELGEWESACGVPFYTLLTD
jgi:hypothetical protein